MLPDPAQPIVDLPTTMFDTATQLVLASWPALALLTLAVVLLALTGRLMDRFG